MRHLPSRLSPLPWLALACVLLALLGSCQPSPRAPTSTPASPLGGANQSPSGQRAEWTVLVYMNADNNLEGAGLRDLQEMSAVGSTPAVNVVVQSDRAAGFTPDGVLNLAPWTTAKRLQVEKGSFRELADLGEVNMDDPRTLTDFLRWAKQAYPARRTMLVLWDHGAAFLGYGGDETGGVDSAMRIPQVATALREGGLALDFLAFDACLMASVEVALELQPYSKVLAVSEEVEPGPGWDYTALLSTLTSQPSISEVDLGRAVGEAYTAFYRKNSPSEAQYVTYSLIDLRQMPAVGEALTAFGAAVDGYVQGSDPRSAGSGRLERLGKVVGQARYDTTAFYRSAFNDPGRVFDLGLLAQNAAKTTGDPAVTRTAESLRQSLAKAVPFMSNGEGFKSAGLSGMTVHLPVYGSDAQLAEPYAALTAMKSTRWPEYTAAFTRAANEDKTAPVAASPRSDAVAITAGKTRARVTGAVTDETLVTGVVAAVTGLIGQQALLVGVEELPRTYRPVNDYAYTFDGMGWYLGDASESQLVFSVQWRPGQRAVFGRYRENADSDPQTVYLLFDEKDGRFIQGFDISGDWVGAVLPGPDSVFLPFLFTPELDRYETEPVRVLGVTIKKAPLPDGPYLISVTGFDIGNNSATGAVTVVVTGEGGAPSQAACTPSDTGAASMIGAHNARFRLPPQGQLLLGLTVDRNRIGRVRHVVDVTGADGKVELRVIGPDSQTVGASGTVHGHAADTFDPPLSGPYILFIETRTGNQDLFLDWTLQPREPVRQPQFLDLNSNSSQVDLLQEPGFRVARFTIPAGKGLALTLALDRTRTPWAGYSFDAGAGPALGFQAVGPGNKALDDAQACGLHMGGFAVEATGDYRFTFDNRQSGQPRTIDLWFEGYATGGPAPTPASGAAATPTPPAARTPVPPGATNAPPPAPTPTALPSPTPTPTRLEGWCLGEHVQDFTIPAGGTFRLEIPCTSAQTSRVSFTMQLTGGSGRAGYLVLSPSGSELTSGGTAYFTQDSFGVTQDGSYAFILDARNSGSALTVRLTVTGVRR